MANVLTPTDDWLPGTVFLAGSIENGAAENWQQAFIDMFDEEEITFLNPRRSDWNPNATEEDIEEQINWELRHLALADLIVMYFDPETKSPITLLELGLCAASANQSLIVCCPEGFWRRTNVRKTCEFYDITFTSTWDELISVFNENFS